MSGEDQAPTSEELREAELLARALDEAVSHGGLAPVEDALGVAMLLKGARGAELSELRERAVRERIWPRRTWPAAVAIAAAVIAAAVAVGVLRPVRPAALPSPGLSLLRAQLAAARPGGPAAQAQLDAEMAAYRLRFYAALEDAYGGHR